MNLFTRQLTALLEYRPPPIQSKILHMQRKLKLVAPSLRVFMYLSPYFVNLSSCKEVLICHPYAS